MNLDGYPVQVLVTVAKECRPNSPKPERAWMRAMPMRGIPEFGNALSALLRDGLLQRKHGFRVKPSPAGYALVGQWKAYRRELRVRPILFDPVRFDPRMSDFAGEAAE